MAIEDPPIQTAVLDTRGFLSLPWMRYMNLVSANAGAGVASLPLSHTDSGQITGVGTNTHAQIDTFISSVTNIKGVTVDDSAIADTYVLAYDSGSTTLAYVAQSDGVTDHTLLTNIGTNTHAQIDTHIASTSNPHSVTAAQVGLSAVDETSTDTTKDKYVSNALVFKHNATASDPTTSSDSTQGYKQNSKWFNTSTNVMWVCIDNTATAAVWKVAILSPVVTTLPTNTYEGLSVIHSPTGRAIDMIFIDSAWVMRFQYGDATVYVDSTGTDDEEHGTGPGTDAYETYAFALTQFAAILKGNLTINFAAETISTSDVLRGLTLGGDFNINLIGTMSEIISSTTVSSATAGSRTTASTLTPVGGGLTASAHKGQWIRFDDATATANLQGVTFEIEDNTTTAYILVGRYGEVGASTPGGTDTFTVVDAGTTFSGIPEFINQPGVTAQWIHFSNTTGSGGFKVSGANSVFTATNCKFASARIINNGSFAPIECYFVGASPRKLFFQSGKSPNILRCLFDGTGGIGGNIGIDTAGNDASFLLSSTGLGGSNVFDGFGTAVNTRDNALVALFNGSDAVKCIIKNNTLGIGVTNGAQQTFSSTTYVTNSGNTTDVSADDGGVAYTFGKFS